MVQKPDPWDRDEVVLCLGIEVIYAVTPGEVMLRMWVRHIWRKRGPTVTLFDGELVLEFSAADTLIGKMTPLPLQLFEIHDNNWILIDLLDPVDAERTDVIHIEDPELLWGPVRRNTPPPYRIRKLKDDEMPSNWQMRTPPP